MSISNPEEFDYLKVAEYDPTNTKNHYMNVYPLVGCVDRSSVHIKYNDNSDYNISFSVHDDGSAAFKALGNKARIIAGEQIFEISNFNTSVSGIDSASVSADQLANVNFKRVNQPRKMVYTTSEGDKKKENVSYLTLKQLLNFFKHGIDMMGFKFVVHGWFPKRGIKDVGHWNGKQLLTKVTDTWPGTVIIGWGHEIHFYGFQKHVEKTENLSMFVISIQDSVSTTCTILKILRLSVQSLKCVMRLKLNLQHIKSRIKMAGMIQISSCKHAHILPTF